MQEVWIKTLEKHLGAVSQEELLDMTIDGMNKIVFGLPSQSDFIRSVVFKNLTDPKLVDDVTFNRYLTSLTNKYETLNLIFNTEYKESFESNGVMYYWIPIELFP